MSGIPLEGIATEFSFTGDSEYLRGGASCAADNFSTGQVKVCSVTYAVRRLMFGNNNVWYSSSRY